MEWNGVHSKGMSGKQVNLTGHVFFDLHLATHLFVVMEPDRMQSGISQNAGKHLTVFSGRTKSRTKDLRFPHVLIG